MDKEIIINSLSDYTTWIENTQNEILGLKENIKVNWKRKLFFRGHASKNWELLPSIFRKSNESTEEISSFLLAENSLWKETHIFQSKLEKLVYFQHYGLVTRLLDVTRNPLIALYFACQEGSNSDAGKVIVGDADFLIEGEDSIEIAKLNAELIFEPKNKYLDIVTRKKLSTACYFEAPINSERIKLQQGAFILPPLFDEETHKKADVNYIKKRIEMMFCNDSPAIIPNKKKQDILTELDICGVNIATIMGDVASKLAYINETVKKQLHTVNLTD